MARVRLAVVRTPYQMLDCHGQNATFEGIRLRCPVLIGSESHRSMRDGFVDTGSELSLIPEVMWKEFEQCIEWFGDRIVSAGIRVAAGEFPFRLGRVHAAVIQPDLKESLSPVSMLAQFTEDHGKLQHLLLGLSGGILQRRRLVVEPDFSEAWIEESDPRSP